MRVTVLRPFLVRGERQETGSVIDIPDDLAMEMIALQKVGPVEKLPPVSGPMTTTTTAALLGGRKRNKGG